MNTTHPLRPLLATSAAILASLTLAGCAINPVPVQQLANARTAIASATLAAPGAQAPEELGRAREKLALSQRWVDARDNKPAAWLAEQALVDAELATAKVATIQAQRAVLIARRADSSLIRTAALSN
jgi:Domain of unknown function (DUF4398)